MRRTLLAILAVLWASAAHAQTPITTYLCIWNGQVCSSANGNLVSTTNPFPVVVSSSGGASGTPNETTVTCGTGSTTLLAAAAATNFILIKVPAAATVPVWVNFAGAAAVAAPPSVDLAAGASIVWSPINGFVPTAQLNCLATSATAVTLVYK